jgi:uncharacterized protein YqjF (DUF2071 family)
MINGQTSQSKNDTEVIRQSSHGKLDQIDTPLITNMILKKSTFHGRHEKSKIYHGKHETEVTPLMANVIKQSNISCKT